MAVALEKSGADVQVVWHKDAALPKGVDLVAIPGGFSFGDYLRCGAIAAQSPICRAVVAHVEAETSNSAYTEGYNAGAEIGVPIAHHDGNYFADDATIAALKGDDRVAFTYTDNPNGSRGDIAGILSENRRVLGMMPHPERAFEEAHGNTDGQRLFAGLMAQLASA